MPKPYLLKIPIQEAWGRAWAWPLFIPLPQGPWCATRDRAVEPEPGAISVCYRQRGGIHITWKPVKAAISEPTPDLWNLKLKRGGRQSASNQPPAPPTSCQAASRWGLLKFVKHWPGPSERESSRIQYFGAVPSTDSFVHSPERGSVPWSEETSGPSSMISCRQ